MKRIITTTIQAAISVALIWWIFHDETKRALMATALREANLWWFLPGLAAVAGTVLLQTFRWQILLRAMGIHLPLWRCAKLLLIGMFFNLFLLGATGGDVVKIYYAMREAHGAKVAAFLSVAVDRVVGILALALVSLVVVAMSWQALMSTTVAQGLVATLALILGGSVGMVIVAAIIAVFHLERKLPARMPFRTTLVDLAEATHRYARSPGALIQAFCLSIPSHLLLFTTFYFAARAFKAPLSLLETFSVIPIVSVITALPISLSGIGVREQLFENLLGALYQVPPSSAVLISMFGYLMAVVWCLIGGWVYLTYRPGDGRAASLSEMEAVTDAVAAEPEKI
jgi:uncharacterized protein (TIRG00374 family)